MTTSRRWSGRCTAFRTTAEPIDVTNASLHLGSDEGRYVTGTP